MNENRRSLRRDASKASCYCAWIVLLLPILYVGSYKLLLVDEVSDPNRVSVGQFAKAVDAYPADVEQLALISSTLKACYREEYAIGGEAIRLFFWPANRTHQRLDRLLCSISHWTSLSSPQSR